MTNVNCNVQSARVQQFKKLFMAVIDMVTMPPSSDSVIVVRVIARQNRLRESFSFFRCCVFLLFLLIHFDGKVNAALRRTPESEPECS